MTEDEMVRWHHRLNGHEFEQAELLMAILTGVTYFLSGVLICIDLIICEMECLLDLVSTICLLKLAS